MAEHIQHSLHAGLWARLLALCARDGNTGPSEIVLRGPYGAGKSELLLGYYREMFENQEAQVPLLIRFAPMPFQPAVWTRRILPELVMQWLGFDRADAELANSPAPPRPRLVEYCREKRLRPLADLLEEQPPTEDAAGAAEFFFNALERAAQRMERRVCLLIDSPEHAVWKGPGGEDFLTRYATPPREESPVRRIWTLRANSGARHPLLVDMPAGAEPWEVPVLGEEAALDLFDRFAREMRVDYDKHVLRDYLSLWGPTPRMLCNLARLASELPRPLDSADALLQVYVKDASEGPTARGLQDALRVALPGVAPDPARIAQMASRCVREESVSGLLRESSARPGDEEALARLARSGLLSYEQGDWRAAGIPILADFLNLYMARHLRGESLVRAEIVLKRERLVEAPRRLQEQEREEREHQVLLLLQTFREQFVPRALLRAHLAADDSRRTSASAMFRMPCCIGAFPYHSSEAPPRQAMPPMPVLIAWNFESAECCRSEEAVWAVFLCGVSTVTTREMDEMERAMRRLAREFNVGKVTGWLITDGAFSPEAEAQAETLEIHVSDWPAFEALSEILMGSFRGHSEAAEAERERKARIVAAPSSGSASLPEAARTVELMLPPSQDIELVAVGALERLADSCGFSKEAITQMKMALQEACLNAVERSANPEKRIRVRFEGSGDKFVVLVENEGVSFDPQHVRKPVLEQKLGDSYKRGWGIQLMRKLMDRVVFEPYEFGVRVRMEKLHPGSAVPGTETEAIKKAAQ